jgi:hypothetical protein
MFIDIVRYTPTWVWGLLLALVALGLSQAFPRRVTLRRSTALPLALLVFSLYGVVSRFGALPAPLLAWSVGLTGALLATQGRFDTSAVRFDAASRSFQLPGSWLPLALMLGLFALKFAAGVLAATHPDVVREAGFALPASTAFGAASGLFLARAASLWTLARRAPQARALALTP